MVLYKTLYWWMLRAMVSYVRENTKFLSLMYIVRGIGVTFRVDVYSLHLEPQGSSCALNFFGRGRG